MNPISAEDEKKDEQTIVELECNTIKMLFESRPRTNGMKFGISVGGLYLRDKLTPNSILPVLIAPQNRVLLPYRMFKLVGNRDVQWEIYIAKTNFLW